MIIVNTANGYVFINEGEVRNVEHRKNDCTAVATFNNGEVKVTYQVESILYTNKQDEVIRDNGLMLAASVRDKEYYKKSYEAAVYLLNTVCQYRTDLEAFITLREKMFTDEYDKSFVQRIYDKRKERPHSVELELDEVRGYPCFDVRKEVYEHGDELTKEFKRMAGEIESLLKERENGIMSFCKSLNDNV